MQVTPSGCVYFNSPSTNSWNWVTMATPSVSTGKCWIVSAPHNKYQHEFYVTGYGYVYMNRNYISSDDSQQNDIEGIENAGSIINQINGFFYTPIENDNETKKDLIKQVGVSAQEVMKVLPEAVTSDENGKLYVDYNALTVFLVETVKEQHQEIKLLHKTLEDNGLLK